MSLWLVFDLRDSVKLPVRRHLWNTVWSCWKTASVQSSHDTNRNEGVLLEKSNWNIIWGQLPSLSQWPAAGCVAWLFLVPYVLLRYQVRTSYRVNLKSMHRVRWQNSKSVDAVGKQPIMRSADKLRWTGLATRKYIRVKFSRKWFTFDCSFSAGSLTPRSLGPSDHVDDISRVRRVRNSFIRPSWLFVEWMTIPTCPSPGER